MNKETLTNKWIDIFSSTQPCDMKLAEHWIKQVYKNSNLDEPQYFWFGQSPLECVQIAFMIDSVDDIEEYNDTEIYSNVKPWINTFERMYSDYSNQYKECEWNDVLKARMLSKISKDWNNSDCVEKFETHLDCVNWATASIADNITLDLFYQESHDELLMSLLESSKTCWANMTYGEATIICNNPIKVKENIEFSDGYKMDIGEWIDLDTDLTICLNNRLKKSFIKSSFGKHELPPLDIEFFNSSPFATPPFDTEFFNAD